MKIFYSLLILFCLIPFTFAGNKQLMPFPEGKELYIYPKNGQSKQQVQQDRFICYERAKKETGFDPSAIPSGTTEPPGLGDVASGSPPQSFNGDYSTPDKGYLKEEAKKEWKEDEIAKYNSDKEKYYSAFSACLEKLGYSVN